MLQVLTTAVGTRLSPSAVQELRQVLGG